jgi:hypothetical protein
VLTRIDRIQIATPNAARDAAGWIKLLRAEHDRVDRSRVLAAKRSVYRLGSCEIEFLEPDGAGPVARALERRGRAHLYAAGVATPELARVTARLRAHGLMPEIEAGQAHVNLATVIGAYAPIVLSEEQDLPRAGRIDFLYEVTLLARDTETICAKFADLFALQRAHFKPISSDKFGYRGTLTLFSDDDLHRFEVICPHSNETTMGRYFEKNGDSYYMAFAESDHTVAIEQAATMARAGITIDRPLGRATGKPADQMWLHASTLGGVMLGISRPTMAWTWSGHPERVKGVA